MTAEEVQLCRGLGSVSTLPGGFDKRFIRNLSAMAETQPEKEMSEKQKEWAMRLLYKYRRQLPGLYQKYQNNPFCSRLK